MQPQLSNSKLDLLSCYFLPHSVNYGSLTQTLDLGMAMQVFYHYTVAADQHEIKSTFLAMISLLVSATMVGLKPLILV